MQILPNNFKVDYKISKDKEILSQILNLQTNNLEYQLTSEEIAQEGFVTVRHNESKLARICGSYGHTVAIVDDQVIAYALLMLQEHADSIPVLQPMFEQINRLSFDGQPIRNQAYLVMGQVCVDKAYRGKGVFSGLYRYMSAQLSLHFQYIITEVSARNPRSIRAHEKVGFRCIHHFSDATDHWQIVLWDWQNKL